MGRTYASRDHATVDGQEEFVARLGGSPHLVSYWRLGSPPFISQEVWPFGRGPTTPENWGLSTSKEPLYSKEGSGPGLQKIVRLLSLREPQHTVDGRNPAPPGMYKTL